MIECEVLLLNDEDSAVLAEAQEICGDSFVDFISCINGDHDFLCIDRRPILFNCKLENDPTSVCNCDAGLFFKRKSTICTREGFSGFDCDADVLSVEDITTPLPPIDFNANRLIELLFICEELIGLETSKDRMSGCIDNTFTFECRLDAEAPRVQVDFCDSELGCSCDVGEIFTNSIAQVCDSFGNTPSQCDEFEENIEFEQLLEGKEDIDLSGGELLIELFNKEQDEIGSIFIEECINSQVEFTTSLISIRLNPSCSSEFN